jgi:hypothetical protein
MFIKKSDIVFLCHKNRANKLECLSLGIFYTLVTVCRFGHELTLDGCTGKVFYSFRMDKYVY